MCAKVIHLLRIFHTFARKFKVFYNILLMGTRLNRIAFAIFAMLTMATPHIKGQQIMKAEGGLRMYGYVPYAKSWTEDQYGLYTFNTDEPVTLERMPYGQDGPVAADGGGCYYDGKYYAVTYAGFMGAILTEFCVYNTETWEMEKYLPVNSGTVSADMDFDPTTGDIYGAFYNDDFDGFVFGKVDPETGKRTAICDLNRIFFGIAVNSKGEVYGLDEEGGLFIFDKKTGERTKIGDTGVFPQYLGSATFDHKTDKLYWSVMREDASTIYLVDTKTANVEVVCKMPDNEEVQGLYIPVPAAEPDAPAVVTGVTAKFEGASLEGTISFTMPIQTYDGSDLDGELSYDIYVNDELFSTGTAMAGDPVEAPVSVTTYGSYKLSVRARNDKGQGPVANTSLWIGLDVPTAVTKLRAEDGSTNGEVVLTWGVPEGSLHGGYVDVEALNYQVIRLSGETRTILGVTNKLTYTDHITNAGPIKPYQYIVTPMVGMKRTGEPATSNSIGVGAALELPYHQNFEDATCMDLLTIVDRHGDNKTWEFDPTFQAARAQYDWTNAKNEWLITPPLHLTANKVYKLSFDTWCREGFKERIEVKMGQSKKYSDLKQQVMPRTEVSNGTPWNNFMLVTVAADGDYYFGFHALSDVDQWWLYLDNISIEEGPVLGTPNSVTSLSVKPAAMGELSATLAFTAPTTTVDGKALDALTGINIMRDGKLVTVLQATPGEAVTYTDDTARQGMNHYTVIPVNSVGDGLEKTDSAYVGVDIPKAPRNVRLTKVDDKPVITWEAPTEGVNGAYVNPDQIVYYVLRSDNKEIGVQLEECTCTDNTLELMDEQAFITYAVFAQNAAGINTDEYGMSNEVCFGTPFELPFHESFKGVSVEQNPWTWDIVEGDPWIKITDSGLYPTAEAADGDGGLVTFQPEYEGDAAILYSSNISLVGAEQPTLSFWYYNNPGTFDKLSARIRIDDDPDMMDEVAYINMTGTSGEEGWTECVCDLSKYIGHRIQLAFKFTSSSDYYMHLDNITVSGLRKDLPMVTDLTAEYTDDMVLLNWSEPVDEQGLGFIGYNVYRNGVLLNEDEPLVDPMYEDPITNIDGDYIYQVTVVYEEGETTFSNAVVMNATGIHQIGAKPLHQGVYTLSGIKLKDAPRQGVFIQNKRKMMKP